MLGPHIWHIFTSLAKHLKHDASILLNHDQFKRAQHAANFDIQNVKFGPEMAKWHIAQISDVRFLLHKQPTQATFSRFLNQTSLTNHVRLPISFDAHEQMVQTLIEESQGLQKMPSAYPWGCWSGETLRNKIDGSFFMGRRKYQLKSKCFAG